jgi:hypothetical protein
VRAALPAVKDCFEKSAGASPDGGTRLVASFQVVRNGGRGHIEEAELDEGSLGNPLDDQCVMNALAAVDFPAPTGEGRYSVKYPFVFTR